ncbi:hypothetical protein D3C73_1578990 [compost metagenome]
MSGLDNTDIQLCRVLTMGDLFITKEEKFIFYNWKTNSKSGLVVIKIMIHFTKTSHTVFTR